MNLIGVNLNLGGEIVHPLPPKWVNFYANFNYMKHIMVYIWTLLTQILDLATKS